MAKLKAPLLSFGASGQIAKSLVYFPWKGLNAVRQHVVPANPKTALQVAQRSLVTIAVALIHTAMARATHPIDEDDKSAYSLWGSTYPTPRTWFNQAVKKFIDCHRLAKIPVIYSDGTTTNPLHTSATMTLYLNEHVASSLAAGKIYLGTSKTALMLTMAVVVTAGVSVTSAAAPFTTLAAGVKYYWQFRPDVADPCEGALSGIYHFIAT
jgi:hypothetical protein